MTAWRWIVAQTLAAAGGIWLGIWLFGTVTG